MNVEKRKVADRIVLLATTVATLALFSPAVCAYDPPTHFQISLEAVRASSVWNGERLSRMAIADYDGLRLDQSSTLYVTSINTKQPIVGLFQFGSTYEDDRALLNGTVHFFNPLNGQGLTTPIRTFTSSPDWILGDRSDPGHDFTWKKARSDFLKASIDPDKAVRKQSWGLTFQKLGHVIHHVQDMAQPQHSRNDPHCGIYCLYAYPASTYEEWTKANSGVVQPSINASYPVVYPTPSKAINSTRAFWSGAGKGLADFSNANFVSAGTNFIGSSDSVGRHPNFPQPFASRFNRQTMADLQNDPATGPITPISSVCGGNLATCTIDFAEVDITDPLNPAMGGTNARASSYSIFDQNLRTGTLVTVTDSVNNTNWVTNRVFALNRYNFVEGYKFLLNRAVAYSAGMINYFFRGEMNLKRSATSPTQFAIKNKGPDDMTGLFYLMYDTADGTRHQVPGGVWALSINAGLDSAAFDVNLNVSPPPAKSNTFILVFSGKMGTEDDAVAVTEVVAKPPIEGLYVLATDTGGGRVVLRVNEQGTQVVLPDDFSPFGSDNFTTGGRRKYLQKQIAFFTTPGGQSVHKFQSLTTLNGLRRNTFIDVEGNVVSVLPTLSVAGPMQWVSRPESNGTADFYSFTLDAYGVLRWSRQRAGGGTPPSPLGGTVTLPASFMGKLIDYNEANFVSAVISPDGLTLYGISAPDDSDGITSAGKRNLKLQISISGGFSASLALDRQFTTFTPTRTADPLSVVDIGTISAVTCALDAFISVTGTITHRTEAIFKRDAVNYEGLVGFIDGQLERFTNYAEFVEGTSADTEQGYVYYNPTCGGTTYSKSHSKRRIEHYIRDMYRVALGGGQIEKSCFGSGVLLGNTNINETDRCNHLTVSLGINDYQGAQDYDGPDAMRPAIAYQPVNPRSPTGNIDIFDYSTSGVLSSYIFNKNPQDAVFSRIVSRGVNKPVFRDYQVKDFLYVMEASPFGDIFFAERDLSKIVHEPGKSGIQQFVPPANIRSIEAAIWL